MCKRIFRLTCLLGLALACLTGARAQSKWEIETIEGGNGKNSGLFTSLAIDKDGNFHLGYFDETSKALRYAFRGAGDTRWSAMDIDASGGFESLAVDAEDHPHFAYAGPGESGLRYAAWNGKKWVKQTIDGEDINFFNCIRIAPNGLPRISYYHRLHRDSSLKGDDIYALHLKYATFDGHTWFTETVDHRSSTGKFNSLALDSKGLPHVAYSFIDGGGLSYGSWDGSEWRFNMPDSKHASGGWVGIGNNIEMDHNDNPRISYIDADHRSIKYASWTPNDGWKIETADRMPGKGVMDNIDRTSIKLDSKGRPHIAYWDSGAGALKHATLTEKGWQAEVVDEGPNVGQYCSLAIDAQDDIYITYHDYGNGQLKMAHQRAAAK